MTVEPGPASGLVPGNITAMDGRDVPTDDELAQAVLGLYPLARRLTGDEHRAADLVQDTWERAAARRHQLDSVGSLQGWLRRILHNLAVDQGRRTGRELPTDELDPAVVDAAWRDDAYTVDADAVLLRAQTLDELEDALVRLPWIYRVAVVAHDVEGMTVREIAAMCEIGLPAAKQRLRRGRMMLVSALAEGAERRARLDGVPLRCWDARQRVSDFVDGDLDAATATQVEAHLATCPTCPPLVAALVGVQSELDGRRDPDTVIPPEVARRLGGLRRG